MTVQSGQSVTQIFTTRSISGVGTSADSLPTGILYVNGVASVTAVIALISTGLYKAVVTMPTLVNGDEVNLVISATVLGVSDKSIIWGDTNDLTVDATGAVKTNSPTVVQIRQELDTNSLKLANLDATISSRMATFSYTAPTTPPTVVQIRQELDTNSIKLLSISSAIALVSLETNATLNKNSILSALSSIPGGTGSSTPINPIRPV